MTNREQDGLLNALADLRSDIPPLPADFHQRWVSRMEEERPMEPDRNEQKPSNIHWVRALAAAAALVFVVAGTLLTKDDLLNAAQNAGGTVAAQTTAAPAAPAAPAVLTADRSAAPSKAAVAYEDDGFEMAAEESAMGGAFFYYDAEEPMEAEAAYDADYADADYGVAENGAAQESKIIRNISLSLDTTDFDASLAALNSLCEDAGGWISWSNRYENGRGEHQAYLNMRIPADALDAFVSSTEGLGRVTSRSEYVDDVTESYYDTASRLASQQALLARLNELIGQAESLSDIIALEAQINDTQYYIDSLQTSLNRTDRQVTYATVDVTLSERRDTETVVDHDLTLGERIGSALRAGADAFISFLGDALVFLVAALPFIAVVAVIAAVIIIVRRVKRKA